MFRYPTEIRIRKKAEYDLVLSREIRISDSNLTVFGLLNNLGFSRFGLIVSKKHGNAVKRNRRKRLLKEAIRLHRHEFPQGLDMVIIPRPTDKPALRDDIKSLTSLSRKLLLRINSGN